MLFSAGLKYAVQRRHPASSLLQKPLLPPAIRALVLEPWPVFPYHVTLHSFLSSP
jgi:hypothetical protein